ncbi:MAG: UDP-N-acetylmuramoyl-L-alanine--D-glutamate ligase [Clostridia bacterium]|nr:UDP-N-acetylmuramoyl-L-alanine--D-glutamate ligase [Clostridia bacterium]
MLIVGFGKSGKASLAFLEKLGAFCYVFDDNKNILKDIRFDGRFSIVMNIDESVIKIMDYLVISPSISIFSEYVKLAKLYNVQVLSEIELGMKFCKGNVIGITGSNGKTTTTSLVYHILKHAKKPCCMCGNIGEPITENILPFKTNYVVEMSSFQLESIGMAKPKIGAIVGITPNHLDRHLTFKNYAMAKFNIAKNMTKRDVLILNFDDKTTKKYLPQNIKAKIIWISQKKEIDGFFAKNGQIYQKKGKEIRKIIDFSQTKLVGEHNITNILFATASCKLLKIKNVFIEFAVSNFQPLAHRLQFVKNVNGVDYVNDSKSTSPNSTITAINSFETKPIILLLGGSDKNTKFDLLAKKISKSNNVKLVVVCGKTSKKIILSLKKFGVKNFEEFDNFFDALSFATKCAGCGDVVLLSPACASFDFFKSFEERGDFFCNYVNGLQDDCFCKDNYNFEQDVFKFEKTFFAGEVKK